MSWEGDRGAPIANRSHSFCHLLKQTQTTFNKNHINHVPIKKREKHIGIILRDRIFKGFISGRRRSSNSDTPGTRAQILINPHFSIHSKTRSLIKYVSVLSFLVGVNGNLRYKYITHSFSCNDVALPGISFNYSFSTAYPLQGP